MKVVSSGQIKEISKLSLQFKFENSLVFEQRYKNTANLFFRLQMAKNLQLYAQDELRYLSYIQSMDAQKVSRLSKEQEEKIKRRAKGETGISEV